MRSADNNWDFWTLLPEALHQVTIVMSERGIPKSFRHMHGFGSHAYSFINARGPSVSGFKFHFRSQQGIQNLSDAEAEALVGKDRESHQRDLFGSIETRGFPALDALHPGDDGRPGEGLPVQPVDLTKAGQGRLPLIEVGYFEPQPEPRKRFRRSRTGGVLTHQHRAGHQLSPDKMLQGRLFSYGDAQRYRLGVNHHHIPVNAPKCPFQSYHRDGAMRTDGNLGGLRPTSPIAWRVERPAAAHEPSLELSGAAATGITGWMTITGSSRAICSGR